MKVVLISDTHTQLKNVKVPKGDMLIHAGDLTYQGTIIEINSELAQIAVLDFKHKIIIAGNHDWLFQKQPSMARVMCKDKGITYLEDSMIEVEGLKIYGSPWQPDFCDWAFNLYTNADLQEKWALIPEGLDILVTHGPPQFILDMTPRGEHVGCQDLMNRIQIVKPKVHVFGHIHDGHGTQSFNDTLFVNASTCDESYKPTNRPIVIEFEDGQVKDIRNE